MAKHNKTNGLVSRHGAPLEATPTDPAADLWNESYDIAVRSIGRAIETLTQAERFAVCVCAGAPVRFAAVDGKPTLQTVNPCRVESVDGRWRVVQVTPPPVTETKGGGCGAPPNMPTSILERLSRLLEPLASVDCQSDLDGGENLCAASNAFDLIKQLRLMVIPERANLFIHGRICFCGADLNDMDVPLTDVICPKCARSGLTANPHQS